MSISNFDKLFNPRSVALIGASDRPHSVGAVTLRNLREFAGELMLVNPRRQVLDGLPVYADVANLPAVPDLAVIAIPPAGVVAVVNELGIRGTKAAIVITAGFGELGEHGNELQRQMLAAARSHGLRIVGPNCIGVIVPAAGLNASFAQISPAAGDIAFLSQSGAMVTTIIDWAQPRGIGFSHIVSLGDMADVDFGDMLAYLDADAATRAIALYVEGITDAGKFMAAARAVGRTKPVFVLKAGRRAEGAHAARSHTGALAGSDVVYDAAFRRAGVMRVETLPALFDELETLALTHPSPGDRLAIITNGGGPGVLATDALVMSGGKLAALAPSTIATLDAILPGTWSRGNPVDMIGDAPPEHYAAALTALLEDEGTDAVLVMNCPTALSDPCDAARAVIATVQPATGRPAQKNVFTNWLGEFLAAPARRLFSAARIATFETPDAAVQGFMVRVRHDHYQSLLAEEAPFAPDGMCDAATVRMTIAGALAAGRHWLDPEEVATVLAAYGIPSLRSRSVADPDEAARAVVEIGAAVALKIRSPDITHKSDVGGVALHLDGSDCVRREAVAMLERVKNARPDARIDGFLLQEMAPRSGAIELIVGLSVDRVFGPVVLFGQGGTAVELIADTTLELPPLNRALAGAQMARTRVWRLLQGYRNTLPADTDAVAGVLQRIGQLAADQPNVAELDINPLLADAGGVIVLDARIAVTSEARVPMALSP